MMEKNSLKQCVCGCGHDDMFHEFGGCFGTCFYFEGDKFMRTKPKIKVEPKPYSLPKYPLMVTALELGMFIGFMAKYHVTERFQKEVPTMSKKIDKLVNSFYEQKNQSH